ncbi:hypothetical protein SALINJAH_170 [Bacillus phage SalinJah]|uniref:Uncharacterized protein n=1 Tax=Bacillus phage SalinJah TaxID=1837830 RepID=A0A173GB61_9CAUD|nr:hypothetical protein SALINJAH_170 [Bacillus phage SalinJah]ANH50621.1 hypothetical protein SALINJAH_170 [Bacillus phage SalinJah]
MSTYDGAYTSNRGTFDKGAWNCPCICEWGELSPSCDKCNYERDGRPKPECDIEKERKRRWNAAAQQVSNELALLFSDPESSKIKYDVDVEDCLTCGGGGFSGYGTGYDAVCDNCGGHGVLPKLGGK